MRNLLALLLLLILGLTHTIARAGDWPTYLHDNARSGVTDEALPAALTEQWVYRAPAAPRPVWPTPQPTVERPKVSFDNAFHTVAAEGSVYFGSSVDHQVYALDAATGRVRWRFFTGGAVRLAPSVDRGRVYFGSDDGKAYCLAADDGRLVWEFDAAPRPTRVIGGGQLSSLWPVRTNLMLDGDRVIFGSGIFPFHGTALIALDAQTGKAIPWRDHAAKAWERLSPQGYLLRTSTGIVVPCGRSIPMVFDPQTANPLYRLVSPDHRDAGGDYCATVGPMLFYGTQNKLYAYDVSTGTPMPHWNTVQKLVASVDSYFAFTAPPLPGFKPKPGQPVPTAGIAAIDRAKQDPLLPKEPLSLTANVRWRLEREDVKTMILAGDRLIVGCAGEVIALDARSGAPTWQAKVEGDAVGLTFAHGRLMVSTTRGAIHCFAAGTPRAPATAQTAPASGFDESLAGPARQAAEGVVRESGVTRGFALVTGPGAAALACELAKRTELTVTCVEQDPRQLLATRQRVAAAGLYGHRVEVQLGEPRRWPYPDYAANLVVHLESAAGEAALDAAESLRVLKPCGGVLLRGSLAAQGAKAAAESALPEAWGKAGAVSRDVKVVASQAPWTKLLRGDLEGSGWWTHAFADAGNTGSSGDQRVRDSLEVLWYGEPGPGEATERHQRPMSPLVCGGRVFYQGWEAQGRKNTIQCFDAYNGLRYWKRELPGAIRVRMSAVSGNLACTRESLFVVTGSRCERLDAMTGETRAVYEAPPGLDGKPRLWGYIAVVDGLLLGSTTSGDAKPNAQELRSAEVLGTTSIGLRFSDSVFAFDQSTGKQLWVHRGKEIRDTTIAYGDGKLFLVENRGEPTALPARSPDGGMYFHAPGAAEKDDDGKVDRLGKAVASVPVEPLPRWVVAIEGATGKQAWEKEVDFADCGVWGASASTREAAGFREIQALCKDGLLLFAAEFNRHGGAEPEDLARRKAIALSTRDGAVVWAKTVGNQNRPIILRDTLLAGNLLRDLRTGDPLMKKDAKTGKDVPWEVAHGGGCGTPSGCDAMVFFRSGGTGWRNFQSGTLGQFMGERPGCFINIIPAGGVVVQPEASSGCTCSYGWGFSIQCSIGFRPVPSTSASASLR